jgi:hypothetical protein
MNSKHNTENDKTELTEKDILDATKEALKIVRHHSFGIAFPMVVTAASIISEWGDYLDCWGSCTKPPA